MRVHLFFILLLLAIGILPVQAQNVIPGQGHTSQGPAGFIKDVHQMELSPMNVKRLTSGKRPADGEAEGVDVEELQTERERALQEFEYNKTQNLQQRLNANVFQFDGIKNTSLPAQ